MNLLRRLGLSDPGTEKAVRSSSSIISINETSKLTKSYSEKNVQILLNEQQKTLETFARALFGHQIVDVETLKKNSWKGIPDEYRKRTWRIFLDYEPLSVDMAEETLKKKRDDYFICLNSIYEPSKKSHWSNTQKEMIRQISIDLPRSSYKILKDDRVKVLFEHVLFVWAIRHPASGYVQGMNDILSPFFVAFIAPFLQPLTIDEICKLENIDQVSDGDLRTVEGDCFWCFSKLLDGIQDVFTKDQPGLFKMMDHLKEVMVKVNPDLDEWLTENSITYDSFAFRWMNCLLVREFSTEHLFRIWDVILSQVSKISQTPVYLCAAIMNILLPRIKHMSGADSIIFIQSIKPEYWSSDDVEAILAQSFVYEQNLKR